MNALIKQPNSISINHDGCSGSQEKATWLPQVVWHCFLLLLIMSIVCLVPALAHAQSAADITLDGLQNAAGDTDVSRLMLASQYGASAISNFATIGTPTTMLGAGFFVFDSVVFVLSAAGGGWILITQIVESAKAGEVLGKDVNGFWLPIRAGIGLTGMLPVFAGFSLAQILMLYIAVLSAGGANLTSRAIYAAAGKGAQLVTSFQPSATGASLVNDLSTMVRGAYTLEICRDALNYSAQAQSAGLPYKEIQVEHVQVQGGVERWYYGPCGYLQLSNRGAENVSAGQDNADGLRGSSSLGGFRIGSVNYPGVAKMVHQAAAKAMGSAVLQTTTLADTMYQKYADYAYRPLSAHPGADPSTLPQITSDTLAQLDRINQSVTTELTSGLTSAADSVDPATNAEVISKLEQGGWITFGLANTTLTEESAAVADAQHAYTFIYHPSFAGNKDQYLIDAIDYWGLANASNPNGQVAQQNQGVIPWLMSLLGLDKNTTGNRSLGQSIATWIASWTAGNSGGKGLVNPLTVSKNMGDWLMDVGGVFLTVDYGSHFAGYFTKLSNPAASWVMSKLEGAVGGALETVAYALVMVGMILSIYIPWIPIQAWIAGIFRWQIVVFEGVVSSQIAMMMHLDVRQEGLGGGASGRFYWFALNVALRPMLMVLSYVFAMALSIVMGTFLLWIWPGIIASIQGNSVTGLLSIVGFMAIFIFVLFSIVALSFNLTHEIPDQVLGWLGAGHSEKTNTGLMGKGAKDTFQGTNPPGTVAGKGPKGNIGLDLKTASKLAERGLL